MSWLSCLLCSTSFVSLTFLTPRNDEPIYFPALSTDCTHFPCDTIGWFGCFPASVCLKSFNCPYFFFLYQHVNALIQYGGKDVWSSDLFGQNKTPLSLTRRFFKGLKVHSNNSYSLLMELWIIGTFSWFRIQLYGAL